VGHDFHGPAAILLMPRLKGVSGVVWLELSHALQDGTANEVELSLLLYAAPSHCGLYAAPSHRPCARHQVMYGASPCLLSP
jgi:hypothetical protein